MIDLSKIYLMQDSITSLVKLGISNNPEARVKQLNNASQLSFRVVVTSKFMETRDAYCLEKELIDFYKEYKFNCPYPFPGSSEVLDLPEEKVRGLLDLVPVLDELI